MKQQLSVMPEKQRQDIAAYIHRLKQNSPAWQKEMGRRMKDMDAGKKFKLPKTAVRA